jgi:redox-sensitive bicupin YhaK (pirin superfamily)
VSHALENGREAYIYLLDEGNVEVNSTILEIHGAAMISDEGRINVKAIDEAEHLLVDVLL